jgi:hypothetical protein
MAEHLNWPRSFRDAVQLPADQVGALVEALIDALDRRDGDIEAEPGTWPDHHSARRRKGGTNEDYEEGGEEDGFVNLRGTGPGCPVGDPDAGADDFRMLDRVRAF